MTERIFSSLGRKLVGVVREVDGWVEGGFRGPEDHGSLTLGLNQGEGDLGVPGRKSKYLLQCTEDLNPDPVLSRLSTRWDS
jgi:hypothetical protein